MSKILKIRNLSKTFEQGGATLKILNSVNLEVNEGEFIALKGPSGCGKTTFLQIVGLLDNQDKGDLVIAGKNCNNISDNQKTLIRRNNLGFVFQFHHLLPEFTAKENVMMPLLFQNSKHDVASDAAVKMLGRFGLKDRVNHKPSALSGGEQQRVAIARALIHKPDLLLADEPTGNLDPKNSQKIFDIFLEQVRESNQTTIFVTHNDALAKKADSIYTIENGKIIKL